MNSAKNATRQATRKIVAKRRFREGLTAKTSRPTPLSGLDSPVTSAVACHPSKRPRTSDASATDGVTAFSGTAVASTDSIADYDSFVKAFAVPTHLYRYLASRRRNRPLFLTRNLRYMRSSNPQSSKVTGDRTISSVICKLLPQKEQQHHLNNGSPIGPVGRHRRAPQRSSAVDVVPNGLHNCLLQTPNSTRWPDEVELLIEGFFDSEKENDWVTVDAKLTLQSRLGWNWRRKSCQRDALVPMGRDIVCPCNPEGRGRRQQHPSPSAATTATAHRFRPAEMLEAAAEASASGVAASASNILQRLNSAQMELRVRVKERRRAKHINSSTSGASALGHTSYVVHYSSAPLPLFYSSFSHRGSAETSPQQFPFLLTPGLYELRLGIQTDFDENQSQPHDANNLSAMALEGGAAVDSGERVCFSGGGDVDNASSAFRFPKLSAAVDEYARWPRLRFRVVWHTRSRGSSCKISNGHLPPINNFKSPRRHRNNSDRTLSIAASSLQPTAASPRVPHKGHSGFNASAAVIEDQTKGGGSEEEVDGGGDCVIYPTLVTPPPRKVRPQSLRRLDPPPTFITYRFLYGGGDDKRLRQWSETHDFVCPWCKLDCNRAYDGSPSALLAHLRTFHPRFRFKANWNPRRKHLSLEVSLNASYDGSNDCSSGGSATGCGFRSQRISAVVASSFSANEAVSTTSLAETAASRNPNQLPIVGGWTGYGGGLEDAVRDAKRRLADIMFKQKKPVRRLPFTHLIYWRGAEQMARQSLEAQLITRQLSVGHNRVYFHANSMQPITPAVFNDHDSESEDTPEWLRQHYQRKVEEFTDINKGEKEMMQTWNAFLLSVKPDKTVVCDNQVTNLVMAFVETYAAWMHECRLRANLILHLTNLVDYGLVTPKVLRKAVAIYDQVAAQRAGDLKPSVAE